MRLHALTACTRPESLPLLAESLMDALSAGVQVAWHIRFDRERQYVGGQKLKNDMLDEVRDGWVAILDDDNTYPPAFFPALAGAALAHPEAQLIVIAQQHRSGWVRRVGRRMLRASHVDAGQIVARREAIGTLRIPEHYCGDGEWIEALADSLSDEQIAYIHEPATAYNALRTDQ
jgi:hypothetical protein